MKHIIPMIALAATGLAGFTIGQSQPKTETAYYAALSLNRGSDAQCQDYVIGAIASPKEIAAMLADASRGAAQYGCVNLIVGGE